MRTARALAAAFSFLTAIPVARRVPLDERDLARGAPLFPLVGAVVGLLVATIAWSVARVLPPEVAAIVAVAGGVALTAAFHLDGLGDVADGVGASLTGREPSEVMRDPRLGTFGVAAVTLDLVLKVALVAALLPDRRFPWEIVGAGAVARVAPIVLAWRSPYAGGGTGVWTQGLGATAVLAATAIGVGLAVATAGVGTAWMVAGGSVVCLVLARWARVRLGGVTGDVFGASAELTETLALAAGVGVLR